MAISFLDLPREIRDQIYACILAPTGYFTLYRRMFRTTRTNIQFAFESYPELEEISFALLETCRQVYQESKDLFWNHNTFYTPLHREMNTVHRIPYFDLGGPPHSRFENRITKIELGVRLGQWNSEGMQKILISLCDWTRDGALKSLCFQAGDARDFVEELEESGRERGLKLVSILRSLYETRVQLAELGVSVSLDLKIGELEYDAMLAQRSTRLWVGNFDKILRLMHNSLSGEL